MSLSASKSKEEQSGIEFGAPGCGLEVVEIEISVSPSGSVAQVGHAERSLRFTV